MLFNSFVFLFLFLPLVLAVWWLPVLSVRVRLCVLVIASYLFYGWWDYRFVSLLVVSTLVDYYVGKRLYDAQSPWRRTAWLTVSVAVNLAVLGFFKYAGFFARAANALVGMSEGGPVPVLDFILPVGISFYTFQTMSYSIDIYRNESRPATSLLHFAAYVSMFPQLVAGPIVRYSHIEDQLREIATRIDWSMMARGLFFLGIGLGQKILLADPIAAQIDPLLADYHSLEFWGAWYTMLGYTCQLYFDFSGYSTMAVGLGLMLGFLFPQNFNSPYKAANISDFWRRWHITLSEWLRDYLFIPLGGSRNGRLLTSPEPVSGDVAGGIVARSRLDVRRVGTVPRLAARSACPVPIVESNQDPSPCCSGGDFYGRRIRMGNLSREQPGNGWLSDDRHAGLCRIRIATSDCHWWNWRRSVCCSFFWGLYSSRPMSGRLSFAPPPRQPRYCRRLSYPAFCFLVNRVRFCIFSFNMLTCS